MRHDFVRFPELTNGQLGTHYFESPHRQILEDFTCECVRVIDGDTIMVKWCERDFLFPVRLINIAAPELKEVGGLQSKGWLERLIQGELVDVVLNPYLRVGKWGRLLGYVHHSGVDVGEQSVLFGHSILWGRQFDGSLPELDGVLPGEVV